MAVFLLKAKARPLLRAAALHGDVFADVPCPSTFAPWIEALAAEGITGGCGGGNYCPTDPVRRDQMAVFLLKTEHGPTYVPPACTPPGLYPDVPCPHVRQLDRAARGRDDHGRLRRRQLLPGNATRADRWRCSSRRRSCCSRPCPAPWFDSSKRRAQRRLAGPPCSADRRTPRRSIRRISPENGPTKVQ